MAGKEFAFGFIISASLAGSFKGSFSTANSEIGKLNKSVSEYNKTYKRLTSAQKKGIITEESYANALAKLNPKYESLIAKQQEYLTMQGKINKLKSNTKAWGTAALTFGGVAYKMVGYTKEAIDFESAMSDVRKVVNFDSPQQFKEMGKDILNMSTRIPLAAEGLAAIVASGGQSGIARKDLISFAESAAKMGVAFDITADQAGEMMAKWRTAFKMGQPEVVELADKVNYLSNKTAATAPLISDVVTRVGPLGAVGGVAAGEIAALGASIVGAGINSEMGATGIKNLILALTSGESATKTQAGAFAALGLDAVEMSEYMQKDAKGAILTVLEGLKGLDKAKQASVLKDLFGKESLGAISPLISNLDELKNNFERVADKSKYANSMEDEFQEKSKTTSNSVMLMDNSIKAVKISMGDGLLPIIGPVASGIGDLAKWIRELSEAYPNATAGALGLVFGFAGVAAGVSGLGFLISGARLTFQTFTPVLKGVSSAVKGFGLVAKVSTMFTQGFALAQSILSGALTITNGVFSLLRGGVMGLWNILMANPWILLATLAVGAAVLIYQNWDTIKQWFITLWDNPMLAADQFWTGLKDLFKRGYEWLQEKWQSISNFLSTPIFGKVNITASGNGAEVAENAYGGIYGRGTFLTTFAENSGESAIPHTPNRRNIGLLAKTNEIMGNPLGTGGGITATFAPQITVQGNADTAEISTLLDQKMREFKAMLAEIQNQNRRLSYG